MTDIVIREDSEVPSKDYCRRELMNPFQYIYEHRYMNGNRIVDVILSADTTVIDELIDSFGTGIKIAEEKKGRLTVCLKSSIKDIEQWALRFSQTATIIEPEYVRRDMENMAFLIANNYIRDRDDDAYYQNRVKESEEKGELYLHYIDLNRYDSFRNLRNIRKMNFRHNWIPDFSFLKSYPDLNRLVIGYNEIDDPSVISGLKELKFLGLVFTEIINLDFLKGLDSLTSLSLREVSLENIDAICKLQFQLEHF